jgi:hypothetical protein
MENPLQDKAKRYSHILAIRQLPDFKTGAFNRSATPPNLIY